MTLSRARARAVREKLLQKSCARLVEFMDEADAAASLGNSVVERFAVLKRTTAILRNTMLQCYHAMKHDVFEQLHTLVPGGLRRQPGPGDRDKEPRRHRLDHRRPLHPDGRRDARDGHHDGRRRVRVHAPDGRHVHA